MELKSEIRTARYVDDENATMRAIFVVALNLVLRLAASPWLLLRMPATCNVWGWDECEWINL